MSFSLGGDRSYSISEVRSGGLSEVGRYHDSSPSDHSHDSDRGRGDGVGSGGCSHGSSSTSTISSAQKSLDKQRADAAKAAESKRRAAAIAEHRAKRSATHAASRALAEQRIAMKTVNAKAITSLAEAKATLPKIDDAIGYHISVQTRIAPLAKKHVSGASQSLQNQGVAIATLRQRRAEVEKRIKELTPPPAAAKVAPTKAIASPLPPKPVLVVSESPASSSQSKPALSSAKPILPSPPPKSTPLTSPPVPETRKQFPSQSEMKVKLTASIPVGPSFLAEPGFIDRLAKQFSDNPKPMTRLEIEKACNLLSMSVDVRRWTSPEILRARTQLCQAVVNCAQFSAPEQSKPKESPAVYAFPSAEKIEACLNGKLDSSYKERGVNKQLATHFAGKAVDESTLDQDVLRILSETKVIQTSMMLSGIGNQLAKKGVMDALKSCTAL